MIPAADIKAAVSLAALLEHFGAVPQSGPMGQRGRRYSCPLCFCGLGGGTGHGRRDALSVDQGGEVWHCHGCGAGGDSIALVRAYRRVGFKDACAWLASWAGLRDDDPETISIETRAKIDNERRRGRALRRLRAYSDAAAGRTRAAVREILDALDCNRDGLRAVDYCQARQLRPAAACREVRYFLVREQADLEIRLSELDHADERRAHLVGAAFARLYERKEARRQAA